jgi:methyl-accepting chemotaxis protein
MMDSIKNGDIIRRLLRENTIHNVQEAGKLSDRGTKKVGEEDRTENKYERVQKLLDNPIFNHAAIVERLYGENDATYRSLFAKKLKKELNDNGNPYEFDDEELSSIISYLMDTSKVINKSVGRKGSS